MEASTSDSDNKRILLVNREPILCKFVARVLASAHYEVLIAHSREGAMEAAADPSVALVLVDPWLAGNYDIALVRDLVALGGPLVIVLSDPPSDGERQRALDAGAIDCISIPVAPAEITARVQQALAHRDP